MGGWPSTDVKDLEKQGFDVEKPFDVPSHEASPPPQAHVALSALRSSVFSEWDARPAEASAFTRGAETWVARVGMSRCPPGLYRRALQTLGQAQDQETPTDFVLAAMAVDSAST